MLKSTNPGSLRTDVHSTVAVNHIQPGAIKTLNNMGKTSKLSFTFPFFLMAALAGCSTSPEKQPAEAETTEIINDFPTQDRVEYVLQCIEKHGGLRYETLYPCICKVDKLASVMTFDEYTQARTFTFLRRTPGEKGGVFRDPPQAKELRKKLKDADKLAEDSCFVKM